MMTIVFVLLWTSVLNFLVCELGQWVTNRYDQLGDELIACDWHLLPIEIQRLYLIFLLNTQQPVHIECYGGIQCSRDTLKKVCFQFLLLFEDNFINFHFVGSK